MSSSWKWKLLITAVCAAVTSPALTSAAISAPEPHPHVGKLPGYPVIRGVIPVLSSKSAVSSHEKLVKEAFAQARARRTSSAPSTEPNEQFVASCEGEAHYAATQDMCYRGGPVLRKPTVHLIFWQGPVVAGIPAETNVKLFPQQYVEIVSKYLKDVAHDSGAQTDTFAVDSQYFDENAKGEVIPGEYTLSFESPADVTIDNKPFPTPAECTDETKYSEGPCLLDKNIQKEVEEVAGTSTKGLGDIYVVLTPPGVGSCFEAASGECAYRQYCAYHGDFGGDGRTPGNQTIYANLPYIGGVRGCDSGVHPNEEVSRAAEEAGEDEGADAVIDVASHELNEAITDPIGSQCITGARSASECEPNAWTDVIGQEVADKCLPPESTVLGIYGEPLGEVLPGRAASLYNQLIHGDVYWTQREWSNEAGVFEGGCVQRLIAASFTIAKGAAATVPVTFDGSASGAEGDPAVYWVWGFGDGEQAGTPAAVASHTYAQPGEYLVTLTVYDAYGNSQVTFGILSVGAAPPPTSPPPAPLTNTVTITTPLPAVLAYSASQIAEKLGVPKNGAKMAGLGTLSLGHAVCPPACAVTLNLTATVPTHKHKRGTIRHVTIGSLRTMISNKGTGTLALQLNASGRKLMSRRHRLTAQLIVTVTGQEGGSWVLHRTLTLTSSARSARHRH
jgi:PKD domain-containing protein